MAKKLTNLKITKVSLVDEGACSAAHITLFKQKGGNEVMTFEEMMAINLSDEQQSVIKAKLEEHKAELAKSKEECEQAQTELEKAETEKKDLETKVSELEAEVEKAKEELKEAKEELEKAKEVEETEVEKAKEEPTEEELLKNVDPAIKEMIEKSRAEAEVHKQAILKMKEEAETAEITEIAKSLNGVGTDEAQMVTMLKKAKSFDVELYAEVIKALEIANNIIADSEVLKEKGTTHSAGEVDAWAKLDAKADEIAKTRGISKAKATNVVIDEFPALYQAYLDSLK